MLFERFMSICKDRQIFKFVSVLIRKYNIFLDATFHTPNVMLSGITQLITHQQTLQIRS
jgi:hypothetical protein